MAKYTKDELEQMGLNQETIPGHVAIIMDGNGRWANSRGLPRSVGHRAGTERLHGIIQLSSDIGIQALTLYAFSTENWKRPKDEVGVLMSLLIEYFSKEIDELHANQVRIRALGDLALLPDRVRETVEEAISKTAANQGLKLGIALNYGSYAEMERAMNLAYHSAREQNLPDIPRELFESYLYTADLPKLDLLIRTGGEERLSNFLLYQASYAELLFTKEFWPDFSNQRYLDSLKEYASRQRRFGGLGGNK